MSKSTDKGKRGEYEFRDICREAIGEWFQIERIGNAEANKHWLHGDIVPVKSLVDYMDLEDCVLTDYFLEAKKKKRPSVWATMDKAMDDASTYGKSGPIAYVSRSRGSGRPSEDYIVMTEDVFKDILGELQGWRSQFESGEIVPNE